jgi:hypothetical protein
MKSVKKRLFIIIITLSIRFVHAQNDFQEEQSNILNYTPSKLLENGKWDIKWFNNLYTETARRDRGIKTDIPRANFFTSTLETFTGISKNKKVNAGLIFQFNSNSFGNQNPTTVFNFKNEISNARNGLSYIAPSVKIAPFSKLNNFSIQSTIFIPLFKEETNNNGFLAANSYIWQNRFFYDYIFPSRKFQFFGEFGTRLFLGKNDKNNDGSFNRNGGYANNSLELAPGAFLSYFATNKFTILGFLQQQVLIDLGNEFSQNYTSIGMGTKYQLTQTLNVEILYSKFIRGNDTGLGQSFNFGLRAIF